MESSDFSKSLAEDIDIEPCEQRCDSELVIRFIIYANDTFHCGVLTSDGLYLKKKLWKFMHFFKWIAEEPLISLKLYGPCAKNPQ